jgi:hypothetical protein
MILRPIRRTSDRRHIRGLRFVGANGGLIVRALVGLFNQGISILGRRQTKRLNGQLFHYERTD